MNPLESFQKLQPGVKAGMAVAGGAGVLGALALIVSPAVLGVIAGGVVVIGLLLVAYKFVLKWLEKRKAAPMEQALAGNSSAAPNSIANPARRARLDDMRRSFETGVTKFKDAGKNIYSLPWYILVGEPGSGKTEAIRHCNVGFPPGLQDQLQGVGGTINMNWWFTNYAVILDTAGRLMFEEVEPGSTSEWQEFLKLLRKYRPNCPVNGMLLVVPAESLVRDTADSIERKAGKIAQQLDAIQRALGVRFPVYVVITKCDLINGFREFFDDLSDPQLQHQILGWSNPASLDEPFNPELVDQHLRSVQQRLVRRRLGLLIDPIHTEDASKKRTEQVDALYALPDSLVKIAPRLRRYLEMIFVAGEWSQKPLFLRGIYFTSSMREGSALDADLAEALGMPVESLPEGRVWERERAYFLRDLFLSKVFRERGLVTRATNTSQQMRKRKAAVFGAAAIGLALVAVFTVLGWRSLQSAVTDPAKFWEKTGEAYVDKGAKTDWVSKSPYFYPLTRSEANRKATFYYNGSQGGELASVPGVDEKDATIAKFPSVLTAQAQRPIRIPWVFKPVALVTGFKVENLAESERARATALVFERSILAPLVDSARAKLAQELDDKTWSADTTEALKQLVALETATVKQNIKPELVDLWSLERYVLAQDEFEAPDAAKKAASDAAFGKALEQYKESMAAAASECKGLQDAMVWIYGADKGKQAWPPESMKAGSTELVVQAVKRFTEVSAGGAGDATGGYAQVKQLAAALAEFSDAERKLLDVHAQPEPGKAWAENLALVRASATKSDSLLRVVEKRSLGKAFDEELEQFHKSIEKSHDSLMAQFAPVIDDKGEADAKLKKENEAKVTALSELYAKLKDSRAKLTNRDEAVKAAKANCDKLDVMCLKGGVRNENAFKTRLAMYDAADAARESAKGELDVAIGDLKPRLGAIDQAVESARGKIKQFRDATATTEGSQDLKDANTLATRASDTATKYATDIAGGLRRTAALSKWMDELPADAEALAKRASDLSKAKAWQIARPRVPMTTGEKGNEEFFDPAYDSRAAAAVLGDAAAIEEAVKAVDGRPGAPKELTDRATKLRSAAKMYGTRYLDYWSDGLTKSLRVEDLAWSEFAKRIQEYPSADSFNEKLSATAQIVTKALEDVQAVLKAESGDVSKLRTQAETARSTLRNNDRIQGGRVFAAWRSLGAGDQNASDAAVRTVARMLARQPAQFEQEYVIYADAESREQKLGDFVKRFWDDFCFRALSALAMQAQNEGNKAFGRLKEVGRFPLVVVEDPRGELTLAEVTQARKDIDQASAVGDSKPDAGPVKVFQNARFDEKAKMLIGAGSLQDHEQKWLNGLKEVIGGLPDSAALKCRIKVLNQKALPEAQAANPVNRPFVEMAISRGDAAPTSKVGLRRSDVDVGEFEYPAPGPLGLYFYTADGLANDATIRISGQWSPLRLLLMDKAKAERDPADKKAWVVLVPVQYRSETFYVWLRLEFEKELPDLAKWRELKAKP